MWLVFKACVLGALVCSTYDLKVQEREAPPLACLSTAQATIAAWQAEHPSRTIVPPFKCVPDAKHDALAE